MMREVQCKKTKIGKGKNGPNSEFFVMISPMQ